MFILLHFQQFTLHFLPYFYTDRKNTHHYCSFCKHYGQKCKFYIHLSW
ncbi:LITAF-like zinc ribbon domain-containing protein [Parabacteroides sp.]